MSPEQWVTAVFSRVALNLPARFSGLGLVLYASPLHLPVASLVPLGQTPELPRGDIKATAELLSQLSDSANPLHDGFHLVDSRSLVVTHLCQFFAPPIPVRMPESIPRHPVGARLMAAVLGSMGTHPELRGEYWTNTKTRGRLLLKRCSDKLVHSFGDAQGKWPATQWPKFE